MIVDRLILTPAHVSLTLITAVHTVVNSWSNICRTLKRAEDGWWQGNDDDDETGDDVSMMEEDDDPLDAFETAPQL